VPGGGSALYAIFLADGPWPHGAGSRLITAGAINATLNGTTNVAMPNVPTLLSRNPGAVVTSEPAFVHVILTSLQDWVSGDVVIRAHDSFFVRWDATRAQINPTISTLASAKLPGGSGGNLFFVGHDNARLSFTCTPGEATHLSRVVVWRQGGAQVTLPPPNNWHSTSGSTPFTITTAEHSALALAPGANVYRARLTDARGRTAETAPLTINALSHQPVTITRVQAIRCNENGEENPLGVFLRSRMWFEWDSSLTQAQLTRRRWRWRNGTAAWSAWFTATSGTWSAVQPGADPIRSIEVQYEVVDPMGAEAHHTLRLPTAQVVMDIAPSGDSVAFGALANRPNTLQLAPGMRLRFGTSGIEIGDGGGVFEFFANGNRVALLFQGGDLIIRGHIFENMPI